MDINAMVIAVDIETRHAAERFISAAKDKISKKQYNSRLVDPEKIDEDRRSKDIAYENDLQRIVDKSALLNGAEIGCIGVVIDGTITFHSTFHDGEKDIKDALSEEGVDYVFTHNTESEMMYAIKEQLNACTTEYTKIVGHNCYNFDFPKIRMACRRGAVGGVRIQVPKILTPEWRVNQIDTEFLFKQYYNCESSKKMMVSLEHICQQFEIPYKKGLHGSEIPAAIAEGRYVQVAKDCISDAIETFKVYNAMAM